MKRFYGIISLIFALFLLSGCVYVEPYTPTETVPLVSAEPMENGEFDYSKIPVFDGETPWVAVNNNTPFFDKAVCERLKNGTEYESYSELDSLGRCGSAVAFIGKELMPTEERGSIGSVKPSGWQTVKYDCVDGRYLYNRCHLIGYQLTGENANEKNLITGTRYMNVQGMLPFEDMVADYIKETENRVLYRVTPIFIGQELIARGVLMEAYSIDDDGDGICFNVFCYNNQPEIEIDYKTGDSVYVGKTQQGDVGVGDYILNTNSLKFHKPGCSSVESIKESNKKAYSGSRERLIADGYAPCGSCKP